ncbi:MAG TPA: squalene/phytoene synthase family protein [Microbacteriaceae bacterium]|nr:squalene/phytoene synthase family protein [Microbacteriaceae bacterium]
MTRAQGLAVYTRTAGLAAAPVIRRYSNSFRLATSLFPRRTRGAIESIYALVRVADEIVDGTAGEAGLDLVEQRERLDELEAETTRAIATGFSANLVVQAFADVARRCAIPPEPLRAFFASMRRDLATVDLDDAEYREYIHGSAEAVGLMCLRVFVEGHAVPPATLADLEAGAPRLGAAFQKVNFLRDLGHDTQSLGRAYFPGLAPGAIDEPAKAAIVAEIAADLAAARAVIPRLPKDCRRAVRVATDIFAELLRRIDRTPAARLAHERVSVPAPVKARIALRWTLTPWAAA